MKPLKTLFIALLLAAFAGGAFWYYNHMYVETLMLSEITGKSDKPLENFLADVFDFDTGLTRHDIRRIEKRKDYWLKRLDEVNAITEQPRQSEELLLLYEEMREDESMKKVLGKVKEKGGNVILILLEILG